MADILLDKLPRAWAGRPIDWDFRPMVWFNGQYLRLPEDEKGLPELARETIHRFYRVAVPPEKEVDAFKALVEFYTAGPQEVSDRPGSSRTEELALDYVTGWLVAAVWHKSAKSRTGALDSKASYKGLVKKGVMLSLVWMAALLDQATHSDFVRDAVCLFFIANEGLSVLENTAVMGVPYPAFVKNMLDALHQTGDQGKGTEART